MTSLSGEQRPPLDRPPRAASEWRTFLPPEVSIREVGPRDGLQNEDPIPTSDKITLLDALSGTGIRRMEAVSFVHPRAIPQMADAQEVWQKIQRNPGVAYSALVPNLHGAKLALDAGFREVEVVISASDAHNRHNINRSSEESLVALEPLIATLHAGGATAEVIIATSFGCPYTGDIAPELVAGIAARVAALGADRISLGDTTGMATPVRVVAAVEAVKAACPDLPLLLHFHDTRGTALANVLAALQVGVTEFDASVGGLGGCPYAPGASGNLATEELVAMLEDSGIDTGVDLAAMIAAAELAERLVGRELPSGVLRAGPRTKRAEA